MATVYAVIENEGSMKANAYAFVEKDDAEELVQYFNNIVSEDFNYNVSFVFVEDLDVLRWFQDEQGSVVFESRERPFNDEEIEKSNSTWIFDHNDYLKLVDYLKGAQEHIEEICVDECAGMEEIGDFDFEEKEYDEEFEENFNLTL
jgi:hypothetical protein